MPVRFHGICCHSPPPLSTPAESVAVVFGAVLPSCGSDFVPTTEGRQVSYDPPSGLSDVWWPGTIFALLINTRTSGICGAFISRCCVKCPNVIVAVLRLSPLLNLGFVAAPRVLRGPYSVSCDTRGPLAAHGPRPALHGVHCAAAGSHDDRNLVAASR